MKLLVTAAFILFASETVAAETIAPLPKHERATERALRPDTRRPYLSTSEVSAIQYRQPEASEAKAKRCFRDQLTIGSSP